MGATKSMMMQAPKTSSLVSIELGLFLFLTGEKKKILIETSEIRTATQTIDREAGKSARKNPILGSEILKLRSIICGFIGSAIFISVW